MTHFKLIIATLIAAGTAIPATCERPRYAIGADSIAAAVNNMGIHVVANQITLLTDVVATSNAPRLRVRSIEKSADHALMVRLECESSDQCIPFYARIRGAENNGTAISLPLLQVPDASQPKAPQVKKGSSAILLLDGEHVHVRLSVICLENGALGQKIRVAAGDPRQIFLAEVVNQNMLKGSL